MGPSSEFGEANRPFDRLRQRWRERRDRHARPVAKMLAAAASLPLHAGFLAAHRPPAPIITTGFVERGALPSVAASLASSALVPQKLASAGAAFGALSFSPFEVLAAFLLGGAFSTSIFAAEGLRVAFGPKNVHRVRAVLAVALQLVIARPPTGLAAHSPAQGHSLGLTGAPSPLRGCGGGTFWCVANALPTDSYIVRRLQVLKRFWRVTVTMLVAACLALVRGVNDICKVDPEDPEAIEGCEVPGGGSRWVRVRVRVRANPNPKG